MILPVESDLSGGLNLSPYLERLKDNEASLLTNFDLINGAAVKRPGITLRSTPAAMGGGLAYLMGQFHFPYSYSQILALANNGKVYRSSDGCLTWTEVLNSVGAVSLNITAPIGESYQSAFQTVSLTSGYWYITTANATNVVGSPGGFFGAIVLDRLFSWNPTTQAVRYTDAGNFGSWPAANTFFVGALGLDGDTIVRMWNYKDRLVIFKKRSIWVLNMTGTPVNWTLRRIFKEVGGTSIYGFTQVDDWIYFIGQYGFFRTNLSEVQNISDPLFQTLRQRKSPGSTTISFDTYLTFDCCASHLNRVIFSVTPTGVYAPTKRVFVFHVDTETWTEYDISSATAGVPVSMLAVEDTRGGAVTDDSYPRGIYFTDNADERFYLFSEANTKTDAISEITCTAQTKKYTFDEVSGFKKIPYSFFDAEIGSSIQAVVQQNGITVSTIAAAAGSGVSESFKTPGPGYVKRVVTKLIFTNPGAGANRDVVLKSIGFNLRVPRPTGIKQVEA